jgi:uncharacterized protein (TIGR03000 family)
VARDRDIDRSAPAQRNLNPNQRDLNANRRDLTPNQRDLNARNRDGGRDWDRNRDGNRWNGNQYSGRHGWDDDDDDDDFWEFLGYSAAARFLGVPFGFYGAPFYGYGYGLGGYGLGGYGYPGFGGYYGRGLYGRGYYNGGYYDRGYYDPGAYQYSEPYSSVVPAAPANDVAMIEVIVPDPDARVWVQDRETTSRGYERTYNSPPLEPGYEYTYTVRAVWRENGETMTAERRVPVDPGSRVTVDFTRGPAETISQ